MHAQRTLRRPISCAGIGLHSGNKVTLSLKPAAADAGIRFRRSDLGGREVPATVSHVGGINHATGLMRDTVRVDTVEHLLAAFVSLGVDNAIVELSSPEVPIMDGSAAPFTYLIQEAGIKPLPAPRRYLKVLHPISLSRGDKRIALYPSDHFKVTYSIAFDHPLLRHQSRTIRLTEESFVEEIAPARTFGFLEEVEMDAAAGARARRLARKRDRHRRHRRAEQRAAVRRRVRAPQDPRRDRRHGARRPSDHRPPGRAPRRPRAAHGVRGARARREGLLDAGRGAGAAGDAACRRGSRPRRSTRSTAYSAATPSRRAARVGPAFFIC